MGSCGWVVILNDRVAILEYLRLFFGERGTLIRGWSGGGFTASRDEGPFFC